MSTVIVYVVFLAIFSALIWRMSKRQDLDAEILEVAPRARAAELAGLIVSAGLLAVFPTVLFFFIFRA